jgi:hypothetical protein
MKLPKRLPYEFALLAALALSSCDVPNRVDAAEENIHRAFSNHRILLERVDTLDERVTEIERKLNM